MSKLVNEGLAGVYVCEGVRGEYAGILSLGKREKKRHINRVCVCVCVHTHTACRCRCHLSVQTKLIAKFWSAALIPSY